MRRRDRSGRFYATIYVALHTSFRLRSNLKALRHASAWTVAGIVWVTLGLAFHKPILLAIFGALLVATLAQWAYFRYHLGRAGLEATDEMTGWEFERWLENFFRGLKFRVERTPYRGDFGADLILTWKNGTRIAVQVKRSARPVSVRAVQEVVAAQAYYRCQRSMVVTNNYFTEEAIILGNANNVRMRSRDDLALELGRLRQTEALPSPSASVLESAGAS